MLSCPRCHNVRLYSVLDIVVISGDDICCSVVFGTLVGVLVFSVMWSELMLTSAISCGHQYTSAREWSLRLHLLWGLSVLCL